MLTHFALSITHSALFIIIHHALLIGVLRRLGEPRNKLQEGEEDKKQPQEVHVSGDRFEWTEEEYTKFLDQFLVAELDKRLDDVGYEDEEGKKRPKKADRVSLLASYYTKFRVRVDAMVARFNAVGVTTKKIRKGMDGMEDINADVMIPDTSDESLTS